MTRRRRQTVERHAYSAGWYDYKTGHVCLSWRKDGRLVHDEVLFRWHFYLSRDDADKAVEDRWFKNNVDDVREAGRHVRVFASGSWEGRRGMIDRLKALGLEPLEADLPPLARYLTDHPPAFEENLRLLFYDLETDARTGWGDKEGHRILSIAYRGVDGATVCQLARSATDEGEKELLAGFLKVVAEHDVLVAWNGDEYDELVLRARCKKHKLFPRWRMVNFLDFLRVFKHPYFGYGRDSEGTGVKVSYALDKVAKALLGGGEGKVNIVQAVADRFDADIKNPADAIFVAFQDARDILEEYNRRDVDIMVELERKFRYIDGLKTLSHICNRFLSSWSILTGYLNDSYVLRHGAETDTRFPTKHGFYNKDAEWWKEDHEKIEGGRVTEPKVGLHDTVCCVDFASLYPSIMVSFNISPETKLKVVPVYESDEELEFYPRVDGIPCCKARNGAIFRTDVQGVFPLLVVETSERRAVHKAEAKRLEDGGKGGTVEHHRAKTLSDSFKVLRNSGFGVLSSPIHRYYDPDCGEAITSTGRALNELAEQEAEKLELRPLAGDTDSNYLRCEDGEAEKFISHMAGVVDEWVRTRGGEPGHVRLELEAVFDRMVFVSKKRYAGKRRGDPPGKLTVKGLEFVRTDGCAYAREFQEAVLLCLLESPERPAAETARGLAVEWRDRLFSGQVDIKKLVFSRSTQKPLDQYETSPVHVDIAKDLMKRGLEVYVGMKIPYIVTGQKKGGKLEVVHADDFSGEYDKMVYWRKYVWPPTMRVLEAAFPNEKWDEMKKHDPGQPDMFESVRGEPSDEDLIESDQAVGGIVLEQRPVVLRVTQDDTGKFEAVRRVLEDYPGAHPFVLEVVVDGEVTEVPTGLYVSRSRELVLEVEELVGHRCYHEKEEWE